MSTSSSYVPTRSAQDAVKGREEQILDSLGIRWKPGSRQHIDCPYPAHGGRNDWRWDARKGKAFCTCAQKGDSVFDVIMKCEGLDFEAAKIRAAELIGRSDLIKARTTGHSGHAHQKTDAESLLNPTLENRDDALPGAYLAHRLGVEVDAVVMPSTPVVGLKALGYFDPPAKQGAKPVKVGDFPCVVFGTVAADGKQHAHRIYVAPDGAGKAELGVTPEGGVRDPKKLAKILGEDNVSGRSVLWGDPASAPWIILAEGAETAAAVAFAFRNEIESNEAAVAAAITAGGVETFQPWPATRRVTVAADRDDQAKPGKRRPSRRGEQAAREFGLRQHEAGPPVSIALPGNPGESADWLDTFNAAGASAVRSGIAAATPYTPTTAELEELARRKSNAAEIERIAATYPLPQLDTLTLTYERTPTGRVKIHKRMLRNNEVQTVPVATPFGMPARLHFLDQGDAYGLRIVVQDMGGRPREIDIERSSFARMGGAEVRAMLFGAGLRVEEDGELIAVQCLKAADPQAEILVVKRPGWHRIGDNEDPLFVCPNGEVIGGTEDRPLELTVARRVAASIATGGTLDGWKEAIEAATAIRGCEHWALGVIAGFAAPLISLAGLDTCGINLSGMSSSGKTTAQRLAASVWSRPIVHRDSLFQSAKATVNSMEVAADRSNGTVLVLDELAHVSGKELSRLIYTLASGTGKRRMAADATLRDSYSWTTFALFSAESSLEEKIRADGGEWTAGMAVRIPDVDVTGVNRLVDQATLAHIGAIDRHFGHAGPAFVRAIIENGLHRRPGDIRGGILELAARLVGQKADSAITRAAQPFAVLNMAGALAQEFGLIPATVDITHLTRWAWDRFRQSSDALALDPEGQAVANLRTWIAERWGSSIRPTSQDGEERASREAVGWYDDDAVYLPTSRLREAAGGALKEAEIAKALSAQGLIAKRKDTDCFFVSYVPRIGKVKAYALSRRGVGRTGVEQEPEFRVYPGGRQ